MTDQLKVALNRLEKLPQAQQDDIAEMILERLDEAEWDAISQSERGQITLAKLVAQADEEIARGDVEEIKGDTFDS